MVIPITDWLVYYGDTNNWLVYYGDTKQGSVYYDDSNNWSVYYGDTNNWLIGMLWWYQYLTDGYIMAMPKTDW
jgi:hypothetical protein